MTKSRLPVGDGKVGVWGKIIMRLLGTVPGRTSLARLARHSFREMGGETKPVDYAYLRTLVIGERAGFSLLPSVDMTVAVIDGLTLLGAVVSRHDREALLSLSIKDLPDWAEVRVKDNTETLIRQLDHNALRVAEFYKSSSPDVRRLLETLTAALPGEESAIPQTESASRETETSPEFLALDIEREGAVGRGEG